MPLDARREKLLKHTFIDYAQTAEFLQHPLIFERANRLHYWDIEGKRYFDGIGGIFVAILGHGHPRVMDAMRRQMEGSETDEDRVWGRGASKIIGNTGNFYFDYVLIGSGEVSGNDRERVEADCRQR